MVRFVDRIEEFDRMTVFSSSRRKRVIGLFASMKNFPGKDGVAAERVKRNG